MRLDLRPGQARRARVGLLLALLVLVAGLAYATGNRAALVGGTAFAALLLWIAWQVQAELEARSAAAEAAAAESARLFQELKAGQDARSNDLALLGRYGNLLIGCTDLAEALQISQQMLSLLLPDSAGTIYPLLDGEGLAEATHLWGIHAADTRMQASSDDCWCMQRHRVHQSGNTAPGSLCSHVTTPAGAAAVTAACIPLTAQGESLGWIYLSAHGEGPLPKLQVAVAAADQLALALANLKLRQSLRDLSVRDPLTGLFNRRYLSESLAREIARGRRRTLPVSVMAFDLDHFKAFNDRYGHPAGDAILVAFARVLQANSRSEDVACRQGGEEFVLILPEMDLAVAMRRAGDLMTAMSRMDVMHEGRMLPKLTTSIGVAVYPQHGGTPEMLLAQADAALYEAKAQGRNRFAVATPNLAKEPGA
jgi:diguanylate cyclase (GGDEF)-like protein